jgi:hypothetical protein
MENDLCHKCINLEIWHSKSHDSKVEVCPLHHLINPSETSCEKYEDIPEEPIDGLCSTCTRLEVWNSKLYKRKVKSKDTMTDKMKEVLLIKSDQKSICAVRRLINPNENVCAEYERIGTQSLNYLCRTCTELKIWYSKLLEIQMEVCPLRHRIMPLITQCLDYKYKSPVRKQYSLFV